MPGQKKSAPAAVTAKGANGNILYVQLKTKREKSQEGKIIYLSDFRWKKCNYTSREQATRIFIEVQRKRINQQEKKLMSCEDAAQILYSLCMEQM